MSTLTAAVVTRQIPEGWVSLPCAHCADAVLVREEAAYTPICLSCRRGFAEFEATKLIAAVNDLVNGTNEFNVLRQFERQEQLNLLGISATAKPSTDDAPIYVWDGEDPDAETRDEIEDLCAQMDSDQDRDCEPFEPW